MYRKWLDSLLPGPLLEVPRVLVQWRVPQSVTAYPPGVVYSPTNTGQGYATYNYVVWEADVKRMCSQSR